MKTLFTFCICFLFVQLNSQTNGWVQKTPINSTPRTYGISFSINNKGYVGFGSTNFANAKNDLWEYDPIADSWTQKTSMPAPGRVGASVFVINNKAYIVGGRDGSAVFQNDCWEFNPATNAWTQFPNLPDTARGYSAAFSIGNKGYICSGLKSTGPWVGTPDVWQLDLSDTSWTAKSNFPDGWYGASSGFAIGNMGYVGFGYNAVNFSASMWEYNPVADSWTQKLSPFPQARMAASASVLGNAAYFFGSYPSINQDIMKYVPSTNSWSIIPGFQGSVRYAAFSFTADNRLFVGMGMRPSDSLEYADLWGINPATVGLNENQNDFKQLSVYPNPASDLLFVQSTSTGIRVYSITNSLGQLIKEEELHDQLKKAIDISGLSSGLYIITVEGKSKKFVKE